jgi:alpha-N-acetylglucosaminidase
MKNTIKMLCLLVFLIPAGTFAQHHIATTSYALIKRVIPARASSFLVEALPETSAKDVFEVESAKGKVILRGNNGVAVASALYHYLTEYAHCQITWNGTNLNIPKVLPVLQQKVHKSTPYEYRYYLNYCTYNYSMSWWDWKPGTKYTRKWVSVTKT